MPRSLLCVLLPLLLGAGATQVPYPMPPDDSTERWVSALLGDDRSERTYAARLLRSRVRLAVRKAERSDPGSLTYGEALAALDGFDALVAPACLQALGAPGATGPCADVLGLLTTPEAVAPLEALLAKEGRGAPRCRTRRRIERALERIEGASPARTDP
ncbi:MAG: hypothetical protein JXB39_16885 [Deltaproteobacteria bacterium]|nr:hypothetical protein [Deltaproteobacteria bacterium]